MQILSNRRLTLLPLLALCLCSCGCSPPALFENEYGVMVAAIDSNAAIPSGMRRTKNGWEDTSLWHISTELKNRSINAWMEHQRQREPSWLRHFFEKVRKTPPLMIAVIQITAVAAIVHLSRSQKAEQSR